MAKFTVRAYVSTENGLYGRVKAHIIFSMARLLDRKSVYYGCSVFFLQELQLCMWNNMIIIIFIIIIG